MHGCVIVRSPFVLSHLPYNSQLHDLPWHEVHLWPFHRSIQPLSWIYCWSRTVAAETRQPIWQTLVALMISAILLVCHCPQHQNMGLQMNFQVTIILANDKILQKYFDNLLIICGQWGMILFFKLKLDCVIFIC